MNERERLEKESEGRKPHSVAQQDRASSSAHINVKPSTEKILRKTVTVEAIERPVSTEKAFTAQPKIRRKKTGHKLVKRIAQALVDSWRPETVVSYDAMDMRLYSQFERHSEGSRLAYLGRPERKNVVELDHTVTYQRTGTLVPKRHRYTRKLPARKGHLELLGLATLFTDEKGKAWFKLHHTKQLTLGDSSEKCPRSPSKEGTRESSKASKQNFSLPNSVSNELTISPVESVESKGEHVGDVGQISRRREEESIREKKIRSPVKVFQSSTLSSMNQSKSNQMTPLEKAILRVAKEKETDDDG